MQKKVNIAGLRLLSTERPACKVGPWLISGNLDFWRVPTTLTVPKDFVQTNTIYAKHPLSYMERNFATCQAEGAYMASPQ